MCLNYNADSKDKSLSNYSPECLGDSLHFTVAIYAYFLLLMSFIDIVDFFRNTMRDASDKVCMDLPPYCK